MLDEVEKKVLERLIFEEDLNYLLEEVDEKPGVIKDVLKGLVSKDYVTPVEKNNSTRGYKTTFLLDSDKLYLSRFVATGKGLEAMTKG